MKVRPQCWIALVLVIWCTNTCTAQTCWGSAKTQVHDDATSMWAALRHAPRAMIQPHNLAWELPIGAATGILIDDGDARVAAEVRHSPSLNNSSDTASTAAVLSMVGAPALAYAIDCIGSRHRVLHPELDAVAAAGFALASVEAIKFSTFRQRPYVQNATGQFWDTNTSFPSGHTVVAWAVASSLAHSYPHKRWLKWSAYAAAAAVGVLRITANQHYPSDVIVGGTLGFLIGDRLTHH